MALQVITTGDGMSAIGSDPVTNERGFLVKVVNGTKATSVKGMLLAISQTEDNKVIPQDNEYDTIGICAESGVADDAEMWMWVTGSICQVLLKDSTACATGQILIAADDDGRAIGINNSGSGLPAVDTHFKECGHIFETKSAGTNVLTLASLHFN